MIQNRQEKIEIMVVTMRENAILWSSVKLKFPLLKTIALFLTKAILNMLFNFGTLQVLCLNPMESSLKSVNSSHF